MALIIFEVLWRAAAIGALLLLLKAWDAAGRPFPIIVITRR